MNRPYRLNPDFEWLRQYGWFVAFLEEVERIDAAHPLTPEQEAHNEAMRLKEAQARALGGKGRNDKVGHGFHKDGDMIGSEEAVELERIRLKARAARIAAARGTWA